MSQLFDVDVNRDLGKGRYNRILQEAIERQEEAAGRMAAPEGRRSWLHTVSRPLRTLRKQIIRLAEAS